MSGEIEFMVTPADETVWARTKQLQIIFSDHCQSGNYQSMYRVKNITGWGRWVISYEDVVNIDIVRNNTEVEAKIVYSSIYKSIDVASGSKTVTKVDKNPPTITSLKVENGVIKGEAVDNESGIHDEKPYLITKQEINFKYATDIDSFAWAESNSLSIGENEKYYFYVRDNVNNVASSSINAEGIDKEAPTVEITLATPVEDHGVITALAKDNEGIRYYTITKDDSETLPSEWITIGDVKEITITYDDIKEDGDYTIWVKDNAENIGKATTPLMLYRFPDFDLNYPADVYVKEGTEVTFEVVYTRIGNPDVYTYQWQVSYDSGATWTNIVGAKEKQYTKVATFGDNNSLYRCVVTHARGDVTSPEGKLEVVKISTTKPNITMTLDKELVLGGVIINGGAASTTSTTLSLNIYAINAAQMSISETNEKGIWQAYKENTTYTLSDNTLGNKTIYVWVKDANGNEYSKNVSATIELK